MSENILSGPAAEKASDEQILSGPEGEAAFLTDEKQRIKTARDKTDDFWSGIALSGGGIRSAAFCLGAVQALSSLKLLKRFDYISSVSGGGYTAAALQWWWYNGKEVPFGSLLKTSLKDEPAELRYLRTHSNYLAPGEGISILSAIAVIMRTMLLNLSVWLPLIILFFSVTLIDRWPWSTESTGSLRRTVSLIDAEQPLFFSVCLWGALILSAAIIAAAFFLAFASILIPPDNKDTVRFRMTRAFWACLAAVLLGVPSAVLGWALTSLAGSSAEFESRTAYFVCAAMFSFAVIALIVAVSQIFEYFKYRTNYGMRKAYDRWVGPALFLLAGLILVGTLPIVSNKLLFSLNSYFSTATFTGLVSVAGGIGSGLYGHFVQAQRIAPTYASRWAATVVAAIFLYSILVTGFLFAQYITLSEPQTTATLQAMSNFPTQPQAQERPQAQTQPQMQQGPESAKQLTEALKKTLDERALAIQIAMVMMLFALAFGYFSNLNHLGLHRYYRDRLMEAFMPSDAALSGGDPYTKADELGLSEVWPGAHKDGLVPPYPLFNTNAILINQPKDPEAPAQLAAVRGGENFILSPYYIGCRSTGWQRTSGHESRRTLITLPSAMAASGAAANANSAYLGTGVTRDRLISIAMLLLNVRLGLWVRTPGSDFDVPNHFLPAFTYGVLRKGYRANSSFMELSDGGHFENLGIYELARRRSRLIVILDSEEDPKTSLAGLVSACQRVWEDFGAEIELGADFDRVIPADQMGYPPGSKFAASPFFIGRITYRETISEAHPTEIKSEGNSGENSSNDDRTGILIYIKSNMIKGLSIGARGYKAKNPEFPNQPTMNQFFEPEQFEAYRELGYQSMTMACQSVGLEANFSSPDTILRNSGFVPRTRAPAL